MRSREEGSEKEGSEEREEGKGQIYHIIITDLFIVDNLR